MSKTLVVAEKPSVAKDIAKTLGANLKGDGFLYCDNYVVSWAIGHLVALYDPEDYDPKLKSWRVNLPIIPQEIKLKPVDKTVKQLNVLKKLFASKEVTDIICATDSGREGELIFRYIYNLLGSTKPFKRLWISSMTDSAIKEGFKNLKDSEHYDNLYISAKCRSESDWLVGINATRAFTNKFGTLLSVGRVQTPTLAILVNRQAEIDAFVPLEYWEVKAQFDGYKGVWFDEKTLETKILVKDDATAIKEKVVGKEGFVKSIDTEEKKTPPSFLYDLTELQRDCNKKFGFSAKKTLEVAQVLYEKHKLITYPRTDSRFLSDDMIPKLTTILKMLNNTNYGEYASYVLNLPKLPITKRIVDNTKITDHHAIIVTEKTPNLKTLAKDEFLVYDLIARRFLSVFYPYYIYNITKITTTVCDENFLTKGTTVTQWGFMELYKNDTQEQKKKDEDAELLPNVAIDDKIMLLEADVLQKKTTAPKAYTEGTLLSAMENAGRFVEDETLKEQMKDSGLGTPATRAAIIERLLSVGYIERKGRTVVPTEKGVLLISVVPPEMKSPETTGKWEKGLVSISKGAMDETKFMESIKRYVHFLVNTAANTQAKVVFPKEPNRYGDRESNFKSFGTCPTCKNGKVFENSKSYFCSEWRNGCKFSLWKDKLEENITEEKVTETIKNMSENK